MDVCVCVRVCDICMQDHDGAGSVSSIFGLNLSQYPSFSQDIPTFTHTPSSRYAKPTADFKELPKEKVPTTVSIKRTVTAVEPSPSAAEGKKGKTTKPSKKRKRSEK